MGEIEVALLTGGRDAPYAYGMTMALSAQGIQLDVIGGDSTDFPAFHRSPGIRYLNLRGDQSRDAGLMAKIVRVLRYYARLIRYAAGAKPKIFHILWNNKLYFLDRTLLMLYYKILGKKLAFTAHNINAGVRDSTDSVVNRLTLKIQYRLADHIFVHTEKMKSELIRDFDVRESAITVIPFGINNSVPNTRLTAIEAKQRLGIGRNEKTVLFFGVITPYKGLEYLTEAFQSLLAQDANFRLIVAGKPDKCDAYWGPIREQLVKVQNGRVLLRDEFIPDEDTEVYFKAADVLVLPYKHIYQSGVLFLGHSFGLPVLAADVGSLKDEIVEGKNGLVFKPEDPADLARAIEEYFASDLYAELDSRRQKIRDYAAERHSWEVVGARTLNVYADLLRLPSAAKSNQELSSTSIDVKASS